jgi:hypothetical protein
MWYARMTFRVSDAIRTNDSNLLVKLLHTKKRTMSARDYDILRNICINQKKHHFVPILDNLQEKLAILTVM